MDRTLELKGRKGCRQVVKTIDIQEETYEALQKMISSGANMTDDVCLPLVSDTYKIFGGNCYGMLVSMAVINLMAGIVRELDDKKFLSMDGEAAYVKMSEALFPTMCYTKDEDGAIDDGLYFFEVNLDEVITKVAPCLADKQRLIFTKNLNEAVKEDNRPVGEIALGILMYISSETCADEEDEKVAN